MKINKFTYQKPDSDGEIRFDCSAIVENKTDFDIELVRTSIIIVNGSNVTVCGYENESDSDFISAKDSAEVDVAGWLSCDARTLNGSGENAKAYVSVVTYKREFVKIGQLPFPAKPGDYTEINKVVSLGGVADLMGVSCLRKKDEDGSAQLEMRSAIRNSSKDYIARAQLDVKLLDQRDAEITESYDYYSLPSKASQVYNPSFWDLKPKKCVNANFNISASVYTPVERYTAEASATLSED